VSESATGTYPEPQGIADVIQPDGQGGFELIADMTPEDWAWLLMNWGLSSFRA
jgi:hypothetical protein